GVATLGCQRPGAAFARDQRADAEPGAGTAHRPGAVAAGRGQRRGRAEHGDVVLSQQPDRHRLRHEVVDQFHGLEPQRLQRPLARDHPGMVGHAREVVLDPPGDREHRARRARAQRVEVVAPGLRQRAERTHREAADAVFQQRHRGARVGQGEAGVGAADVGEQDRVGHGVDRLHGCPGTLAKPRYTSPLSRGRRRRMRLSTIKLSGFKSFVDPTTLHLPTNMTGVVGPNGCGKSNIIDAIRWVMGESAASRLRGDSLTDVIFSGSSARKPVSQASVELIFDNSDHTITGEYGAYDEISVKRTVGRDGQSSYYLNGSKCRRRDITDLFLGTGLGPRSYSIIEQGMISQIIEARPEDLRVYLEEAAGISKYKERRRETENRIKHTRENLERLTDLREEVGKQLDHLKRQARQAEQYQAIQAERRVKDAEWKALEFRGLDARLKSLRDAMAQDETKLQELIAGQREAERRIEEDRVRREQASEALNKAQAEGYQVGGTLARIEQQITHQREMAERLQRARDEAQAALAEIGTHISGDEARLASLREAIAEAEPKLAELQADDRARQEALRDAEARLADWQQRWDAHAREQSEAARAADVERTRVDYLDRQALDAERRRETLAGERGSLDVGALGESLAALQAQHDEQKAALDGMAAEVESRKQAVTELQDQQRAAQAELSNVRREAQEKRGRLSSLETLQNAALGQEQGAAVEWLRQRGLDSAARVGESLQVEPGWENAVEGALGQLIEGVLVESPEALVDALGELGEGRLALVDAGAAEERYPDTSLAAKVRGPAAIRRILGKLHAAETLADARALLPRLGEGESVVTRA